METRTLSARGRVEIPQRLREALQLEPGDNVLFLRQGDSLILRREPRDRARLVLRNGRKVLIAPPGAPPMTTEMVKALLADFP